jgi:hypothetical protein
MDLSNDCLEVWYEDAILNRKGCNRTSSKFAFHHFLLFLSAFVTMCDFVLSNWT